jgi:hypothetical protein
MFTASFFKDRYKCLNKLDVFFVLICLIFLYTHLFIFPATPIFYEEDHLIFLQDAWKMYEGNLIYRDFFQFTFPGTQLIYLFLFSIFGTKFWLLNFVIMGIGLISVCLTLVISKRVINEKWMSYLPVCLYLFFGFRWFGLDGSHRMISPIFVLSALFILLKERSLRRICLAGIFCALSSFFTQQRGFLAVGAIGIYLIWEAFSNKQKFIELVKSEIVLIISFLISLSLLILPFLLTSGFETFFNNTIFFISNYVQDTSANYRTYLISIKKILSLGVTMSAVTVFYYFLIPLIYLVTFVYLWKGKKSISTELWKRILLINLVGFSLAIGTFAPNPARLFQVSIPALILLAVLFDQKKRPSFFPKVWVFGLIIFGSILAIRLQLNWEKTILETRSGKIAFLSPVIVERYQWLQENANSNDNVFEVYNCAVNFPLLLQNPAQVPFLLNTGYTSEAQVTNSIQNLENKKVRFIIWDQTWDSELLTIEKGENLLPLLTYLRAKYEIKKNFTPYNNRQMQIWERKPEY